MSFPDIIDPIIPHGSISTFSGASGVGKTAFLAGMIATFQRNEPLWGLPTVTPPAIGYLACDRPWRDHAKWFAKAGCADFPHFSLRDVAYNWAALRVANDVPTIFGSLVDQLRLPPGSLLIVDPISLFLPGRLIDYKDMAIAMGVLDAQLQPRQLTCIGIFHVGKQKGSEQDKYTRPKDRILGSNALLGYSETAFYLLDPSDTGEKSYTFGISSHQSRELEFKYTRTANGLFAPADFFDQEREEQLALECLPTNGDILRRSAWLLLIMRALECSQRSAERAIQTLFQHGRVERVGQGKYRRTRVQ